MLSQFTAVARSKRDAEHAAALQALASLAASGLLALHQVVEVAVMQQRAAVEAAAAEAAAAEAAAAAAALQDAEVLQNT